MGNYKEEVDENAKKSIDKLKEEMVSLKSELKIKQSNYDKLSNESQKTIADLRNQIDKLKTSKLSENGAGQKQDQMTTKIKYKARPAMFNV